MTASPSAFLSNEVNRQRRSNMAERRYGFRFSFAEGCVLVGSLVLASFLVFVFGVYAGKELEARQAAESTRTVRMATQTQEESTVSRLTAEENLPQGKTPTEKPSILSSPFPTPGASLPMQKTSEPPQKTTGLPMGEKPATSPPVVSVSSSPVVNRSSPPPNPFPSHATPRSSSEEAFSANRK